MGYYGLGTVEEILADLEIQMLKVDGIKFVDYQRIRASGASVDRYPGVYINLISTDKTRLLKDLIRNMLGIQLVCWIWAAKDEDLITKQNAFTEDVEGKVMADPTRGSQAYDTVIENVTTDSGSRHPQAMAVINLVIVFYSEK